MLPISALAFRCSILIRHSRPSRSRPVLEAIGVLPLVNEVIHDVKIEWTDVRGSTC